LAAVSFAGKTALEKRRSSNSEDRARLTSDLDHFSPVVEKKPAIDADYPILVSAGSVVFNSD
jgi:hypothetical protein